MDRSRWSSGMVRRKGLAGAVRKLRRRALIVAPVAIGFLASSTMPAWGASPTPQYHYYRIETGAVAAHWINNRGDIAGSWSHPDTPFHYSRGVLTPLPEDFVPGGILDDGAVVGTDWGVHFAAIWRQGEYSLWPGLPEWTEILGVTPAPAVVGQTAGIYADQPFYADLEGMHVLAAGPQDCTTCWGYIYDGNAQSEMVGMGRIGSLHPARQPIVWRNGTYNYLTLPAGVLPPGIPVINGWASAINDVSTIVGGAGNTTCSGLPECVDNYVAVAWISDQPVPLSLQTNSYAWDVSKAGASPWDYHRLGIAVGEVNGAATMWCTPCFADECDVTDPSSTWVGYDLNDLLVNDEPVEPLTAAYGINDCGMIVGQSSTGSFVLVPADSLDTDEDGLLDQWETCGIDGNDDGSIDLVLPGADPKVRDLFVEIDVMSGVSPPLEALEKVVAAFDRQGINLHFVGDADPAAGFAGASPMFDDEDLPSAEFTGDGLDDVYALRCSHFGSAGERSLADAEARTGLLKAKSLAFRYAVIGRSYPDSVGAGGMGEYQGNVFTVTLDDFPASDAVDDYAATIMHELGHNLGLDHGGHQDDGEVEHRFNYKPNYPSVMNYTWSFPVKIDGELDYEAQMALQLWRDSWRLDYSSGTMNAIDESSIPASVGLGGDSDRYVPVGLIQPAEGEEVGRVRIASMGRIEDWFPTEFGPVPNVNANYIAGEFGQFSDQESIGSLDVLEDHDDWSAIDAHFLPWREWERYPFDSVCSPGTGKSTRVRRPVPSELRLSEVLALGRIRFDCNGNGNPDDMDLIAGTSADADLDGIPDECQSAVSSPVPPEQRHGLRLESSPNPFNPRTEVTFSAPAGAAVRVEVCDAMGRRLLVLFEGRGSGGAQAITWEAGGFPSGIYFLRMTSGDQSVTRKVALLR